MNEGIPSRADILSMVEQGDRLAREAMQAATERANDTRAVLSDVYRKMEK